MIKAGEKIQEDLFLREGERIDDLERNGYGIIQKKGAFCFGMDARRNGSGRGNPEQTPGRPRCVKKPANR